MTQLSQSNKKIFELNTCTNYSKLSNYNINNILLFIYNPSI